MSSSRVHHDHVDDHDDHDDHVDDRDDHDDHVDDHDPSTDHSSLFRYKPFLRDDPDFGNPPSMDLLLKLKPSYWFAAHMHAKFAAVVGHPSETPNPRVTKFLALSKPLPGQNFIQVKRCRWKKYSFFSISSSC